MKKHENFIINVLAIGMIILLIILGIAASWGIVCGLIKLITLCFGWHFSLKIATGIWLIILLIGLIFGKSRRE